jgi:hypothetical protein
LQAAAAEDHLQAAAAEEEVLLKELLQCLLLAHTQL